MDTYFLRWHTAFICWWKGERVWDESQEDTCGRGWGSNTGKWSVIWGRFGHSNGNKNAFNIQEQESLYGADWPTHGNVWLVSRVSRRMWKLLEENLDDGGVAGRTKWTSWTSEHPRDAGNGDSYTSYVPRESNQILAVSSLVLFAPRPASLPSLSLILNNRCSALVCMGIEVLVCCEGSEFVYVLGSSSYLYINRVENV